MSPKPVASPACSLDEAPDSYRGYLAPAEIAAVLQAMAAGAPAAMTARLAAIRAGLPAPAAQLPPGFTGDATADLDRLLPRIRDDALHAALRMLHDAGMAR